MFEKSHANNKNNRITVRTSVKVEDLKNLQEKASKSVTCVEATLRHGRLKVVQIMVTGRGQGGPQWRLNFYVGVSNEIFFKILLKDI